MVNHFNNLKIKHKFFLTNFVIVILVCVTSLIVIQIALSLYQKIIYREIAKELNLSAIGIENELDQIERYSFEIVTNDEIQSSLDKLRDIYPDYTRIHNERRLSDKLWSMTFERNIISVNIIDAQGKQYSGGAPISQTILPYIIKDATKKMGAMVFLPPFDDNYIIGTRQIRKIRDLNLEPLGTLIIRINTPSVIKQFTAGSMNNQISLIVRSDTKNIYAPSSALEKISEKSNYQDETGYQIDRINGRNYFVSYIRSNYTHWLYISILPYQAIFWQISVMRTSVLVIFVILLFTILFLSMRFAKNLTVPIEDLSLKMKHVQNGDFSISKVAIMSLGRSDEIGELEKDFDIMVNKINDLINENYVKQILIKNTQLKALRANINPHFLYNTLESINWLAKTNNQKEISLMVESLGRCCAAPLAKGII